MRPGPRPRVTAALLAAALAAGVGACGGDDRDEVSEDGVALSIVPRDTTADTTGDPTGDTIGDTARVAVAVPGSFPAEVPLPPDVELEQADELVAATTIYDITGWHPGTPVPVGEAYLAELRDAGFEIESRSDASDSILFVAVGEDWFVSAGFYADPVRNTGTAVGVTVGPAASAPLGD